MVKILLSGLLMIIVSISLHAQTYYPSGSTNTPTWGYQDVVIEDDGAYYNPVTGKSGCVISDAFIDVTTFANGDAYDGAFEFFINVGDSVYTESGLNTSGVDTVGTTISLGEQWIDGFFVSKKYFFSPTEPMVRAVFKVRNPTGSDRTTKLGIYTNLGSDSETKVAGSSTGGANLTDADRWMITTDGANYNNGDPINTWVRFGPGSIASVTNFGSIPEAGNDEYVDTVAFTVPANSYSLVIQYNRLDTTVAAALTNTAKFNNYTTLKAAGYLSGITSAELLRVVNWDFSPINVNQSKTICEKGSYTLNGHTYTLAGTYKDTLQSVSGRDSIIVTQLTVNPVDSTKISAAICEGDTYDFLGTSLTVAGTFYHTLENKITGCDSVIVLTLTSNTVDLTTTLTNNTVAANQAGATYQWVDCNNNNAVIVGATNQSYVATQTGSYAVIVTKGACSKPSECKDVVITGIKTINSNVTVSPNPGAGLFKVSADGVTNIQVINNVGVVVYRSNKNQDKPIVDITNQAPGIYIIEVTTKEGTSQYRVLKH